MRLFTHAFEALLSRKQPSDTLALLTLSLTNPAGRRTGGAFLPVGLIHRATNNGSAYLPAYRLAAVLVNPAKAISKLSASCAPADRYLSLAHAVHFPDKLVYPTYSHGLLPTQTGNPLNILIRR